jgi:hypothetical protein
MNIPMSFILALIAVESNFDDSAWNRAEDARGPLQIRRACLADVRRVYGVHYAHESMHQRDIAVWVCRKYLQHYVTEARLGRPVTLEDYAKCWNGGPNFFRKPPVVQKRLNIYWNKVKEAMNDQ